MEQKPESDRGARLVRALLLTPVMLLAHFVALTCVLVFLARLAPIHFEAFVSMDIELPKVTVALIRQSSIMVAYWYVCYLALFLIDGPILFVLQYISPRLAWLKSCWFSGWLLAAVLYLFWGFLAISIVWEVLQREIG